MAPRLVFDLSPAVKAGENQLRIEVATTLERKPDRILVKTFALYSKSPALTPIGILGYVGVYQK